MGFQQSPHEAAVYRRGKNGNALLVGVYVDDLVITDTKEVEVQAFKEEMKATFQMSDLGLLSFYLGIEVHQDSSGISLCQTVYANTSSSWAAHRLQPSLHSYGGEAEAELRQHGQGGRCHTVPAHCG